MRSKVSLNLDSFNIQKASEFPVFKQLSDYIRNKIVSDELRAGDKLPSIRALSKAIQLSPDTVKASYSDLAEEGLIISKQRSGFTVAEIPEIYRDYKLSSAFFHKSPRPLTGKMRRAASALKRYKLPKQEAKPFACFVSEKKEGLSKKWISLETKIVKSTWSGKSYGGPLGYLPLRKIIADRLRQTRGIICEADQIIITTGTIQSLSLCAQLLFQPGDSIFAEDPSLQLFPELFSFSGISVVDVPVDAEGIKVRKILEKKDEAGGVLVSPSSQYPMSVTLSAERRRDMVAWANESGGWIIEDDIDNLLAYTANPLKPIRALPGSEECTIYIDSFSLLLSPGLRLGFMVVPKNLADSFAGAKLLSDRQCPESTQAILAHFLESNSYETHLRRLLVKYRNNREILLRVLEENLRNFGKPLSSEYGSHLAFMLNDNIPDVLATKKLVSMGVQTSAISSFCRQYKQNGLLLGFGGFDVKDLEEACQKIKPALEQIVVNS